MSKYYHKIRNADGIIHEGDDINIQFWTDVNCYFITSVENQKKIKVRKYIVVGDRSKSGGMGHQDWVYFKTSKEKSEYLKKFGIINNFEEDNEEQTWVFRYGYWWKELSNGSLEKITAHISIGKDIKNYYYDWSF